VLLALSLWIKQGERACYPSQERLAQDTALSIRAIKHHLQLADDEGWIYRTRRRKRPKDWGYTVYEPTIPIQQGASHALSKHQGARGSEQGARGSITGARRAHDSEGL
jgi:DNA-binding transcriptional MocR family regulator